MMTKVMEPLWQNYCFKRRTKWGFPEADLLIAKAISDDGSGTDTTIADAVDWCVDGGTDIISLNLGGSQGFGSGFFTTDQLEDSVQDAIDLGVYVEALIGNDGESG